MIVHAGEGVGHRCFRAFLVHTRRKAKRILVESIHAAETPTAAKTMVSSSMEWFMMRW